jgi:hypothetical protein
VVVVVVDSVVVVVVGTVVAIVVEPLTSGCDVVVVDSVVLVVEVVGAVVVVEVVVLDEVVELDVLVGMVVGMVVGIVVEVVVEAVVVVGVWTTHRMMWEMSLPEEWPYEPPVVGSLTSWFASSLAPALMIIRSQLPPPTGAGTE